MPSEQPLAQDLMQEALSSKGSHVERFLSPTIFSGLQAANRPLLCWLHEDTVTYGDRSHGQGRVDEALVSVHLNFLIFHSVFNHTDLVEDTNRYARANNID